MNQKMVLKIFKKLPHYKKFYQQNHVGQSNKQKKKYIVHMSIIDIKKFRSNLAPLKNNISMIICWVDSF